MTVNLDGPLVAITTLFMLGMTSISWRQFATSKTAKNEMKKLTANALNTISVGVFLGALLVPALLNKPPNEGLTSQDFIKLLEYMPYLTFAVMAHVCGRWILSTLED